MHMLQINALHYNIGERCLFDNLTLTIDRPDKVGLIGVNGSGKTTLLRMIAGQLTPDAGTLNTPKNYQINYLPQDPVFPEDQRIIDYIFDSDLPVIQTLKKYETTLEELRIDPENPSLAEKLIHLQESIDRLDGWDLESQIKTVITKLDIPNINTPVNQLSGGQKKRVALAAAILRPSDLLILDEPTNHLDDTTILWLEDYLKNYSKSILLVTHDRYFLDRVTNRIVELDHGQIYSYQGNYSVFVEKKAERLELASTLEQKRKNLYRKELAWMRTGARARSTKQKARIDRFHEIQDQSFAMDTAEVELLTGYSRMGKKTIELEHVSMGFDDTLLFKDFSVLFQANDRVGIIGPNGTGKTTLLNLITGQLKPLEGSISIGPTIKIGYYSQHFPEPNISMTLIEYIRDTAEYVVTQSGERITATVMLERFLFDKSTHYAPIEKLSGGEKRRLFLLKVLMESPNVLILDEPTNDLDIDTLKALEDYLDDFIGIVIVVSHDRYFLDRVCRRLFIMQANSLDINVLTGNYSEILEQHGYATLTGLNTLQNTSEKTAPSNNSNAVSSSSPAVPKAAPNQEDTQPRKLTYNEKREFEGLDEHIHALEKKLDTLEQTIQENQSNYSLLEEAMQEKDATELELLEAMERLEFLSTLRQ